MLSLINYHLVNNSITIIIIVSLYILETPKPSTLKEILHKNKNKLFLCKLMNAAQCFQVDTFFIWNLLRATSTDQDVFIMIFNHHLPILCHFFTERNADSL